MKAPEISTPTEIKTPTAPDINNATMGNKIEAMKKKQGFLSTYLGHNSTSVTSKKVSEYLGTPAKPSKGMSGTSGFLGGGSSKR